MSRSVVLPTLARLGMVSLFVALVGCGQTPATAPKATKTVKKAVSAPAAVVAPAIATDNGRVEIQLGGLPTRGLMATVSQVAKIQVTLSGGPLETAVTKEVTTAQLNGGHGTVSFESIASGTVNVRIDALDASGGVIGSRLTTAMITGGQTAVVAVSMKLLDTHVAAAGGGVEFDLTIEDGDVVVDPIATPSPRASSPVLDPAPSPTPTPTPGTFALRGDLKYTRYADGKLGVAGFCYNGRNVDTNVKVTVEFVGAGLFGERTKETQTLQIGSVTAGTSKAFEAKSTKKIAGWGNEGSAKVTFAAQ